jgi:hypothetical protein
LPEAELVRPNGERAMLQFFLLRKLQTNTMLVKVCSYMDSCKKPVLLFAGSDSTASSVEQFDGLAK